MSSLNDGASGGRSEGLISFTIEAETEVKNMLKWFAISPGLLMDWLLTVMLEIEEDLAEFFLIASLKISQVFFILL